MHCSCCEEVSFATVVAVFAPPERFLQKGNPRFCVKWRLLRHNMPRSNRPVRIVARVRSGHSVKLLAALRRKFLTMMSCLNFHMA